MPVALPHLEARPLPPGWEHPRDSDGTGPRVYLPLSCYADLPDWQRGTGSAGEHAAVPPLGLAGYMVPGSRRPAGPVRVLRDRQRGDPAVLPPSIPSGNSPPGARNTSARCPAKAGRAASGLRPSSALCGVTRRTCREGSLPVACAAERQAAAGKSGAVLAALAVAGFDTARAREILSAARSSLGWQARVTGPPPRRRRRRLARQRRLDRQLGHGPVAAPRPPAAAAARSRGSPGARAVAPRPVTAAARLPKFGPGLPGAGPASCRSLRRGGR